MIKYIELKTGFNDNGPGWIADVELSSSGQTIYFNGKALKKIRGGGISGNYSDMETGDEYWISNVKKDGLDRHWAGSGKVKIESSIVDKYLNIVGAKKLNASYFKLFEPEISHDKDKLHKIENKKF